MDGFPLVRTSRRSFLAGTAGLALGAAAAARRGAAEVPAGGPPAAAGMGRAEEFAAKLARVRGLMQEKQLAGVLLKTRANFAWLSGGGDSHVFACTPDGVGSLLVTQKGVYLLANNVEKQRLLEEELTGLPIEGRAFPWHHDETADIVKELCGGGSVGADFAFAGGTNLDPDIMALRFELLPAEIDRYRALCRDAGQAIAKVAREFPQGQSEREVAARFAHECLLRGIGPWLCIVGGDDRVERWRHPLQKDRPIHHKALMILCGERHGLYANVSRLVSFGKLPKELADTHRAVCRVDATLIDGTRVGRTWGDVLAEGIAAYAAVGFPGMEQNHHQGGPAGYLSRDFKVFPGEKRTVHLHQAVTWNPSMTGTKSEDTFLVTENGNQCMTASPHWPMVEVEANGRKYSRPDILER